MSPVKYHFGKFPPSNIAWELLVPYMEEASMALGRYDGSLSAMPNAKLLLSPLTTNEAVLSSKIEGTEISVGEIMEVDAGVEPKNFTDRQRRDSVEVLNYRRTLNMCAEKLKDMPISEHFVREAHQQLMNSVRGTDKNPGAYRKEQNWIGHKGCTVEEADFLPIAPEHLSSGMERFYQYVDDESVKNVVVQMAVMHAEFEALHPFCDGNGRLGRMLIPLFLYQRKVLSAPSFYMSAYLEKNREEYISRLRRVSSHDEWTDWIIFFLKGVASEAKSNAEKAKKIFALRDNLTNMPMLTKLSHSAAVINFIFTKVAFTKTDFENSTQISSTMASRILNALEQNNIIISLRKGSGRQSSLYLFPKLLAITEGLE